MKVHDLRPPKGSKKRRIRVGRGTGGHRGKTAGRGHKGQKARNKVPVGFEGGQMPLQRRVPKLRGFNNPFRIAYAPINLDTLEELKESEITPDVLKSHGLIKKQAHVKILGRGEISRSVQVSAHAFSESAISAIESAGGSVTVLPKVWGDRRPPAQGSAHTNR